MNPTRHTTRLAALAVAALAVPASAGTVVFELDTVISGDTPGGPAPYATMTFTDVGAGQVSGQFQATGLAASEFISELLFSIDPLVSVSSLSLGSYSTSGMFELPDVDVDLNDHNGIQGSRYDIELDFATSNSRGGVKRFTQGDSLSFLIESSDSDFDSSSFSVLVDRRNGGTNPYYNQMHIQGIAGGGSAKVSGGPTMVPNAVPTPSAAMAGMAMLGIAAFRRRRRA
jgi:MYXO-CTERM domain-containing protein